MPATKPKHNLVGRTFNFLTVIRPVAKTNGGKRPVWQWECRCKCGKLVTKPTDRLLNNHSVSCGCSKRTSWRFNPLWKGCGEISACMCTSYRLHAKNRGIQFDIKPKDMWEQYELQNGVCALTGEQLTLPENSTNLRGRHYTASLDRIDSSKGYIRDNIQWVHKKINRLKWDLSEEELIYWCERVVKWNSQKSG